MPFYETFDAVFWITITTILTGSIGLAIKFCLKSKCDDVNCCWGGLVIHRNVELEQEEEMKAMELGISDSMRNVTLNTPPKIAALQEPEVAALQESKIASKRII